MEFKKVILYLLILLLIFTWYKFVYSSFFVLEDIKLLNILSKNIYPNSQKLNSTIIVFNSNIDISKYSFQTFCKSDSEFLYKLNNNYFFSLKITDQNCTNSNFYLKDNNKIFPQTNFKLNIISYFDLFNKFSDYDTKYLVFLNKNISKIKWKYKIFASIDNSNINYDFVKKSRFYDEIDYQNSIIEIIKENRKWKYIIPIVWYSLPTRKDKIPNFSRSYRSDHTDWIHHGWDIDASFWTPVVSIDEGIIIRVVNDFKYSDLHKIKKTWEITYTEKLNNLDIYRWNQVWLKTSTWDIMIYAHLDKVFSDIKVWDIIKKWYPVWTIWITWVPDKSYNDYHLHFEIQKNPYNKDKAWKYTFLNYMSWDWYFKWKQIDYILKNQYNVFEK